MDADGTPGYRFYGTGGADRQLQARDMALLPAEVEAVHVGSYACVVEPIAATMRALVEARRHQAVISYDPNMRLGVEPKPAALARRAGLDGLAHPCAEAQRRGLRAPVPGADMHAKAAQWLHAGVRMVAITRGAAGASLWTREGRAVAEFAVQAAAVTCTRRGPDLPRRGELAGT